MLADVATIWAVVVLLFTACVVFFALYALVRPFTHTHYHHETGLWHPLD